MGKCQQGRLPCPCFRTAAKREERSRSLLILVEEGPAVDDLLARLDDLAAAEAGGVAEVEHAVDVALEPRHQVLLVLGRAVEVARAQAADAHRVGHARRAVRAAVLAAGGLGHARREDLAGDALVATLPLAGVGHGGLLGGGGGLGRELDPAAASGTARRAVLVLVVVGVAVGLVGLLLLLLLLLLLSKLVGVLDLVDNFVDLLLVEVRVLLSLAGGTRRGAMEHGVTGLMVSGSNWAASGLAR